MNKRWKMDIGLIMKVHQQGEKRLKEMMAMKKKRKGRKH
jgi:hypothetical protein